MEERRNNLSSLILETLRAKNLSVEKLSQMTGVPERFLNLLIEERFEKLPAAPYVHGYLLKIAQALNLEGDRLWGEYLKDNALIRRSGKKDELPPNRFALSAITVNKKIIAFVSVLLILGIFVVIRLPSILGVPKLFVDVEDDVVTSSSVITLSGTIEPKDQLTINGELIYSDSNGAFTKTVTLETGFNTFVFNVKRFLGKERTAVKQIFYQTSTSSDNFSHGTE